MNEIISQSYEMAGKDATEMLPKCIAPQLVYGVKPASASVLSKMYQTRKLT